MTFNRAVVDAAAVAVVDFEVDVAVVEVLDVEALEDFDNEESPTIIEQKACPPAGVMQSNPKGQQLFPHVGRSRESAVVSIGEFGNAVTFCFWTSHETGAIVLQSSPEQQIIEDPLSIETQGVSLGHLKLLGNRESTSLHLLLSREKSWLGDPDRREGMDDEIACVRSVEKARSVQNWDELVDSLILGNISIISVVYGRSQIRLRRVQYFFKPNKRR